MTEATPSQEQMQAAIDVLDDHGIDFRAPWQCDLDDSEKGRFEALQCAIQAALDVTPRLAQTTGLKVDEETKVILGMILLEKWQTGSSPADIVNAFLDALAPGNAEDDRLTIFTNPEDTWDAYCTDTPEEDRSPQGAIAFVIDRMWEALASPSSPQDTVRYQTQLQNPDLDERALPQSQIDSVSSTDEMKP